MRFSASCSGVPERDGGVDAERATAGPPAGTQRGGHEHASGDGVRRRIPWRDAEQEALEQVRGGERAGEADRNPAPARTAARRRSSNARIISVA
jgi:hypothetical protein